MTQTASDTEDPTVASTPQRVVITGVSRGIGRATALAFAARGACVAGLHLDQETVVTNELSDEIERLGGRPLIRVGDTRSSVDVDALANDAVALWGGIDVWVNNAARLLVAPFLEMTDERWRDLLDSNLFGFIRGARAAARYMVPAGEGTIINLSSCVEPLPPTEMTAYVTAKGGISGLARALAVELGPSGITVNAVGPGAVETPLNAESWDESVRENYRDRIPLGRIAEPADIADTIVMLSSRAACYITGQIIFVDGGLTINGSVGHKPKD